MDTETTFDPETDGTWLMVHRDGSTPDLVFIKTSNTASGKVEVHIASGASNYQARILDVPTTFDPETDGTWLMVPRQGSYFPDLVFIKTSNAASGKVEVHIASGTSNYQARILDVPTTFDPETDGTWLMVPRQGSYFPDLVFIKTSNAASGKVEVHIASGTSNYQARILDVPTTFDPETDGTWLMVPRQGSYFPDLVFIKTRNTASGTVEVHIASGASNYQTRILEVGTTFAPETDGTWLLTEFDSVDVPDLVFIKTSNTGTGTVEVHVASGASNYQTRILEVGTAFAPETDGTWQIVDRNLTFTKTSKRPQAKWKFMSRRHNCRCPPSGS